MRLTAVATVIAVASDPGDPVGQGVPHRFDSNIQRGLPAVPNEIRIELFEPLSFLTPAWSFVFRAANGPRSCPTRTRAPRAGRRICRPSRCPPSSRERT